MIKHLKIKFVCINMLIVTVMLAVIFGMVLHFTHQNMEYQSNQILQKLHESQFRKVPMEAELRTPYFMVHISRQGTVSVSSASFFTEAGDDQLLAIARTVYDGKEQSGALKAHDLRYSREKTPFGERIVFIDVSRENILMQNLIRICAVIGFLSLSVFFVISMGFAQWAVKPVDQAWKQQQQFVADASHELKTPLTVILTNAELLQSGGYDEVSRHQFAQSIYAMSLQMRGLVESLLNLARLDSGSVKETFSELNFSELVSDGMLPFEPLYFEREMELQSEIEEDLWVLGSDSHLRQVLDILLDNALKYAFPGCRVSVMLRRQGSGCVLAVSNPGEEISGENLKNIFKRFYRADKARTMNHSYGLGLPIAKGIVQEHGGKIWAESQMGINTFFVQLPLRK